MDKKRQLLALIILSVTVAAGCGGANTATSSSKPADAKGNAAEILAKMTEKIKAAPAFSFNTAENSDRPKRGGGVEKLNVTRNTTIRSPDRMYFKTTGDRDLETFYDGKSMILMSHKDKVWGQFTAPPTLGETMDKIKEHYGMPMPVADLLGLDAKGKLRNPANVATVEKNETVGGVECSVLKFQNADVDWEVWIPVSGDPLPKKFHAKYKTTKGQPESTIEFSDWNLAPQITDNTFLANIPNEYEGIPVIQRAAAVGPKNEEVEKRPAGNSNTNAAAPKNTQTK
ncbi:MAG: DUF2092 domain-containing protein [Saprospiraceae bacterium]|nr:DUF2092 domain-containing protein [Pyrinomonadaceae bacterium]